MERTGMIETVQKRSGLRLRNFFGRRMARKTGRNALSADQPYQLQRARMDKAAERTPCAAGVKIERIEYAGRPALKFSPPEPRPGSILYLHGGGYSRGSAQSHKPLVSRLSKLFALEAVSLDYRMAPEHVFPAAVEDAADALAQMTREIEGPILLAGDSAGGGLALASVLRRFKSGGTAPDAIYLISPWTDLSMSGESLAGREKADPMLTPDNLRAGVELYLDGAEPENPEASPLFADFDGFPPVFIQAGTDEILLSDSTRLHDRLTADDIPVHCEVWQGMWHDFQLFSPIIPEADHALARARDWLTPHLST